MAKIVVQHHLALISIENTVLGPNSVSWNQPQLRPMLEKDVASSLLRIDSNSVISDNCTKY